MSNQDISAAYTVAPSKNRIVSLDVIRGYALFIVLLVNLWAASGPVADIAFPGLLGPMAEHNIVPWLITMTGFFGVGRALFGMLFGAGMMLILERLTAAHSPEKGRNLYFRRLVILFLFALADIYLLMWWGDILLMYSLIGMLLYMFRTVRMKWLMIWTVIFALIPTVVGAGQQVGMAMVLPEFQNILALREAGTTLTPEQLNLYNQVAFILDPAVIAAEKAVLTTGTVPEVWAALTARYIVLNLASFPVIALWDIWAAMLLGIYLYRSGFLTGEMSGRRYRLWLIMGLLLGLGLRLFGYASHSNANFDSHWPIYTSAIDQLTRFLIAIALISAFNLMVKNGLLKGVQTLLSAVGRMALTNYLTQSIFYVLIFTNIGFGQFGQLSYGALWGLAVVLFTAQGLVSVLWLKSHRYGPVEWLWRKLTYGRDFTAKEG